MTQELEWGPVRAWVEDGLRTILDEAWEVEAKNEGGLIRIRARFGGLATVEATFNTETGVLGSIKITYRIGNCTIVKSHRPVRIGKSPTALMDVGATIAKLVLGEPH